MVLPKENPPDVPKVEGCDVAPKRLGPVLGLANRLLAGAPKPLAAVVVVPNAGLELNRLEPCKIKDGMNHYFIYHSILMIYEDRPILTVELVLPKPLNPPNPVLVAPKPEACVPVVGVAPKRGYKKQKMV